MKYMKAEFLSPAIAMPEWLSETEQTNFDVPMPGNEEKLRFTIKLAVENVCHGTGGPFGAAVFDMRTDRLIAAGINSVVPAQQFWAHAEMTALSRAQHRLQVADLKGCMLVASCEPCAMCFGAIPWSGVACLIYGAAKEFAEKIGFDEGDKIPHWQEALRKRKIQVNGPLLETESREPFLLYRQKNGFIY